MEACSFNGRGRSEYLNVVRSRGDDDFGHGPICASLCAPISALSTQVSECDREGSRNSFLWTELELISILELRYSSTDLSVVAT